MLCHDTLKRIEQVEKDIINHPLTNGIKFLLNNQTQDNHDTAQFLLDPRRVWNENWVSYFSTTKSTIIQNTNLADTKEKHINEENNFIFT